ncbi:cytochrome c biogenesis protein CcsA [Flavobacterium sp. UBA6135]|uniref:cytochrome c biogenesis protein CcsA n=1 Tax=Flavobacterium sp. UBA6135 TaxID=1946553 RepID=UPI0025C3E0E2|nr:cytochrome c biogenesis protein CcsA [Flavobacterium sp. UBA6135]
MVNKITSVLFSTKLMALLFIGFAAAMAAGTFIESYYNTDTARIWVYNAWWFEVIMVFFVINFIGNIKRYQLWRKEKWATLLIHMSFIFILVGAFVTRYISFEGMMPIREGATERIFYSDKAYLSVLVDGDYQGEMKRKTIEKPLILSQAASNDFKINDNFDKTPFSIRYKKYIMNVTETLKENENGEYYIKLVESSEGTRHEHYLKAGEVQNLHNILFAFNKPTPGAINVTMEGEKLYLESAFGGDFMRMADQLKGNVYKDSLQVLQLRSLYNLGGTQFVFPEPPIKGLKEFQSNNDWKDLQSDDALMVTVEANGESKEVTLVGAKGKMGIPESFKLGDLEFTLLFGSKVYELPFGIKLNDFIAERYPGTLNNYASFESKVTVVDNGNDFDARIFMNNILDHRGYRFFQASFHPDEKGTVLSVNHDFWGTWITYIGYFLLYLALMVIMFDKNTRFADLKRKLEKVKLKKAGLSIIAFLVVTTSAFAQESLHNAKKPSLSEIEAFVEKNIASKEHAAKFGALVIQDQGGRMKPVNTFSSELLRKVSKSDHYKGFNSDQVFLSMSQYPFYWMEIPIIYLKKGNDSIRKIIGVDKEAKFAPFVNFFDKNGNYLLSDLVDEATKAAIPNQFQKDFIEINKRVVLLNTAFSGSILRLFPIPNDENNTWISYPEMNETEDKDIQMIKNLMPLYMSVLQEAHQTKGYAKADELVEGIEKFQLKFGEKVRPSEKRIHSEVLYNKYDIFKRLFYLYMMAGVLMLIFTVIQIFKSNKVINTTVNIFHWVIGFLFVLHTAGLIVRWYISGHAPWSDAYESMIYVAWATMFFGLAFDRKSKLTVASASFVTAMILMIAHWNWMDPSIANLQPVLNSYWLMIHVAVIVASYGPFTLAMILGIVALLLMLLTNENNKVRMKLNIQEITYINEMALTIGLVMLTIGNFLGGQWANESWGRYWGWDPKETWALISIMVYAFVIHMRFVPFFRGLFVFNFASIIAFYSIMMTYFGVNFYLTGLHSYASGDKVVTPNFVYISVIVVIILGIFAYINYKKHLKAKQV